ncbi:hypothetical protein [Kaistella polysaccharea]|uniref:hypothetical protein n=1 Tax=Kaistella polysaccharea TaxID=2878534 RepID=UPI001CF0FEDC|nr:hypothetical protein [Kaistella polysaccharea]
MFSKFQSKTRVLLFSKTPSVRPFFLQVLNFHGKQFDYFSSNQDLEISENDFVILESFDPEIVKNFKPNIAVVTSEVEQNDLNFVSNSMISGGVLIYPQTLNAEVEAPSAYFRKLEFTKTDYSQNGRNFLIKSPMGSIPFHTDDEILASNLSGLQLLAQQFGIMEEEFYEAVMEFTPA